MGKRRCDFLYVMGNQDEGGGLGIGGVAFHESKIVESGDGVESGAWLIEEKNLEGAEDWVSYLRIIRNTCTSNVKSSVALANHMTHVASAINDHLIPAYTLAVLERKDNSLSTEE